MLETSFLILYSLLIFLLIKYLINAKDFEDFSEAVTILLTMLGGLMKIIHFMYNTPKIKESLEILKELVESEKSSKKEKESKLMKRVLNADKMLKVLVTLSILGNTSSLLVPILNHELPMKLWIPFEYQRNEFCFLVGGCVGIFAKLHCWSCNCRC